MWDCSTCPVHYMLIRHVQASQPIHNLRSSHHPRSDGVVFCNKSPNASVAIANLCPGTVGNAELALSGTVCVAAAATGRLGSPKKGGAGGKGSWGT